MTILQSLILGIIEGVSEFLPISSTGHLILASRLLSIGQSDFVKSFEIAIQLGAILAAAVLYGKTVYKNRALLKKIIVGFIPTGVLGLLFYKIVKKYLLGNDVVVLWSLAVGGAALILFEFWYRRRAGTAAKSELSGLSYRGAFGIGIAQSVAMVPGISRSAATIVGGMGAGLTRSAATEFSFLLAVPTMAAATFLDLIKSANEFSSQDAGILAAGFLASFFVAMACIRWLIKYVRTNTFVWFGIYRILAALAFFALVVR